MAEAGDERQLAGTARPFPSRPGEPRLPDHGPFRGIPTDGTVSRAGAGAVDSCAAGGIHRVYVPSRLFGRLAPRAHPAEGEPRARVGSADLSGGPRRAGPGGCGVGELPDV